MATRHNHLSNLSALRGPCCVSVPLIIEKSNGVQGIGENGSVKTMSGL